MNGCYCIGPQNGEPLCPCKMRELKVTKRGGKWVIPEREIGDVIPSRDSDFEEFVYAVGQRSGGSPANRRTVEFDCIEWNVDYNVMNDDRDFPKD